MTSSTRTIKNMFKIARSKKYCTDKTSRLQQKNKQEYMTRHRLKIRQLKTQPNIDKKPRNISKRPVIIYKESILPKAVWLTNSRVDAHNK